MVKAADALVSNKKKKKRQRHTNRMSKTIKVHCFTAAKSTAAANWSWWQLPVCASQTGNKKKERENRVLRPQRGETRKKCVWALLARGYTHTRTSAAAQLLHGGNSPLFFYIFPVETWLENQTVGSEPDAREERCELGWNKVFSFLRKVKKIFEVCEWVLLCNQLSYNVIFAELFVLCELAIIAPSLRNVPAEMPWRESKKNMFCVRRGVRWGERDGRTDGRVDDLKEEGGKTQRSSLPRSTLGLRRYPPLARAV